jgi:alpha-tubulin suppressor-like RCC1 family protein
MQGQPVRAVVLGGVMRAGRSVVLQQRAATGWRVVGSSRTDTTGRAEIPFSLGRAGRRTYRAVVPARRAGPTVRSRPVVVRVARERVVVSDRVLVLTGQAASILFVNVDSPLEGRPETVRFDRDEAPPVLLSAGRGSILAVPPSAAFPDSALLEVVGRHDVSTTTVLDVRLGSLADAVVNVPDAASSVRLRRVGPVRVTPTQEGVTVSTEQSAADRLAVDLDVDSGADLDGGRPGSRTRGSIEMEPLARFAWDTDWGRVQRYDLGFGWRVDESLLSELRSYDKMVIPGNGTWPLFRVDARFSGSIGRLPVWLRLSASVDLTALSTRDGRVTLEWSRRGTLGALVRGAQPDLRRARHLLPEVETAAVAAVRGGERATGELRTATTVRLYSGAGLEMDDWNVFESWTDAATGGTGSASCSIQEGARSHLRGFDAGIFTTLAGGGLSRPLWTGVPPADYQSRPCAPPSDPEIITEGVPEVVVGEAYRTALEVADHREGTWTVVGELPAGLSMTPDGIIEGTYRGAPSSTELSFQFADRGGRVVTRTLAMTTTAQRTGSRWSAIDGGPTSCGIRTDGTGWCWGRNEHGQVGDGTTKDRPSPVRLPGTWVSLSPGATSCGIQVDGTGWCWGENYHGQVGDGRFVDATIPTQLPGTWTELRGGATACGVRPDGSGWCWGENSIGQVGDGTAEDRATPTRVAGSWRSLVPGFRSCGLRDDGSAWCWGGGFIEYDDGTVVGSRPHRYAEAWRTVPAGESGCGIRSDGTGWCGQYGSGPVPLPGALDSLDAASRTQCAVRTDGSGWCWAANEFGQVGNGSVGGDAAPHQLEGTWRSIDAGDRTCGVRTDDTGWCWGYNRFGGVADGTTRNRKEPSQVPGSWATIDGSCGIRTDGTGWCWGSNGLGPVADGSSDYRTTPVQLL